MLAAGGIGGHEGRRAGARERAASEINGAAVVARDIDVPRRVERDAPHQIGRRTPERAAPDEPWATGALSAGERVLASQRAAAAIFSFTRRFYFATVCRIAIAIREAGHALEAAGLVDADRDRLRRRLAGHLAAAAMLRRCAHVHALRPAARLARSTYRARVRPAGIYRARVHAPASIIAASSPWKVQPSRLVSRLQPLARIRAPAQSATLHLIDIWLLPRLCSARACLEGQMVRGMYAAVKGGRKSRLCTSSRGRPWSGFAAITSAPSRSRGPSASACPCPSASACPCPSASRSWCSPAWQGPARSPAQRRCAPRASLGGDVGVWNDAEARVWWAEHGSAVEARRRGEGEPVSGTGRTIAVDVLGRRG